VREPIYDPDSCCGNGLAGYHGMPAVQVLKPKQPMLEKIAQDYQSNFTTSSSYYKYLPNVTPDNFDLIDVK
jgi:hypothetical protein